MLRRPAAAAAVVLSAALVPAAHANGTGGGVCGTGDVLVTVCAQDHSGSSGSSGSSSGTPAAAAPAASGDDSKPTDKCSYDRVDPPPPGGASGVEGA